MSEDLKLFEIKTHVITTYVWHVWAASSVEAEYKWNHSIEPPVDEYEDDPLELEGPTITEIDPSDVDYLEEDDWHNDEED